jgi:hypothetical protein
MTQRILPVFCETLLESPLRKGDRYNTRADVVRLERRSVTADLEGDTILNAQHKCITLLLLQDTCFKGGRNWQVVLQASPS